MSDPITHAIAEVVRKVVREELARAPERAQYITVDEAASIVSCSTATIRDWISEGTLKRYRVGRRGVRIKRTDLDAALVDKDAELTPEEHALLFLRGGKAG